MKWKLPELPSKGDIRYVRKFAWTPTIIKGYKVWLEFYFLVQEYDTDRWLRTKFGYKVPYEGWFFKGYQFVDEEREKWLK